MATLVAPIQMMMFAVTLIFCYMMYSPAWFSYHPVFMMVGYLGCMSNSIFYENWGSKHWTHMILHIVCLLCVDFAWYVIWTNKNMAKKSHNTSWHSWVGVACLAMNNMEVIGSMYSLWPSKPPHTVKPQIIVTMHRWSGRLLFIGTLVASHMGFYKLRRHKTIQWILFDAFLIAVAVISMTKWIRIKSLWSMIRI